MKKFFDFERMDLMQRRQFLKSLGIVLASPFVPGHIRYAANEIVMGANYAEAQTPGSIFIEINMRDQYDFMGCFVPPGLATNGNLIRGTGAATALFDAPSTLLQRPGNFYLTQEGRALDGQLDSIAVLELCEMTVGDIHGHEAANSTRSPGRGTFGGAGRGEMFLLEGAQSGGGNMPHYSATPTPAILHNYYQRQISPGLRRGIAYKGVSRDIHTAYHYAANLVDAQIDRYQTTNSLTNAFGNIAPPAGVLATHGALITNLLKLVDASFAKSFYFSTTAQSDHNRQVASMGAQLGGGPAAFSLALTAAGVSELGHGGPKAQIWEQVAYASKLVTNNLVRTVALEFDFVDVHGGRDENAMRAMGTQVALPLLRLIQQLKAANLYDRTIIAMYTTDGGRTPVSDSYGSEGKNSIILAGGRVRGGYYGDIRVAGTGGGGHTFSYHMPEMNSGQALPGGTTGNDRRVPGASVWKTVAKASGIPASLYNSFTDTAGAPELNYLLR
ncbi:MAG: hypothetical protein ABL958_07915 [Bdellovibrionia bacterium]